MKVFVTDGNARAALAVTRSLGRRGHEIVVGEREAPALAQASRYCTRRVTYADPFGPPGDLLASLLRIVRDESIDVVVPVADITTWLVCRHRADFERHCRVPFGTVDSIEAASDKARTVAIGRQVGVPVPRTWVVAAPSEADRHDLPYPIVVKPHRSRVPTAQGWIGCTVSYANDRKALRAELARRRPLEFPILLQERIPGAALGAFLCCHRGERIAAFSHRRLREKPPSGGVSVLCESVPLDGLATDYAERLLRAIGWQGIAMVEFKLDEGGVPHLMEINGRFWGSLQLAIDSGVDFPALLLETLDGAAAPPAKVTSYALGVKSRWIWGDFDALLIELFGARDKRASHVPGGKLGALARFAVPWQPGLHYDNPTLDDVRPFVHETLGRLRGVRGRTAKAAAPSGAGAVGGEQAARRS